MAEVAGNKVAGCLPKTLLQMLDTLCEHEVKTWNIYPDRFGIAVRIRFDIGEGSNMGGAGSSHVYMQGRTGQAAQHTAYTRKTPSQHRRDSQRKILRAKRRKVEDVEDSDIIESDRNMKGDVLDQLCYTPEPVCCKPPEDVIVLPSLSPITIETMKMHVK